MPASDRDPIGGDPRQTSPIGHGRCHHLAMTVGLAVTHAVLFMAAYPSVNLWPLSFLAIAPLWWLAVHARTTRRALLVVFIVQLVLWLWMNRWILPVTAAGYPLLSMYMAGYAVLFVWLVRRVGHHRRFSRWPATCVLPILWVGVECLRGELIFRGYPWYLLAHPLIEWPVLVQSVDLLGTYWLSFLSAMVSGAIVDMVRMRSTQIVRRAAVAAVVFTLVLHAANIAYGLWRLGQPTLRPGPSILVIQTNLAQDNKIGWPREQQVSDFGDFVSLTEQAHADAIASGTTPDLVVWPETMVPGYGLEPETIKYQRENGYYPGDVYSATLTELVANLSTPLLVGSPSYFGLRAVGKEWNWDRHYNSAYLVLHDPPYQRYDKHFLTPFGETMPYISAWPWLEQRLLALGAEGMRFNLDSNPDIKRLRLDWNDQTLHLGTPICFEDTVAWLCRKMVYGDGTKSVEVLVNLSNDGWFGASVSGRRQHVQIARFRCVENRVPMVRAANTGLSVAIDSRGKLIGRIGEGRYGAARTHGTLFAELPLDSRSTLYGRLGDVWAWLCLLGTVVLGGSANFLGAKETKS